MICLFNNVKLVFGKKKSCLLDFNNGKVFFIDNRFIAKVGNKFSNIIEFENKEFNDLIEEKEFGIRLSNLLENHIIDRSEPFPSPFMFNTVVLYTSKNNSILYNKIPNTRNLVIVFDQKVTSGDIINSLHFFEESKSVVNIEIILSGDKKINFLKFKEISNKLTKVFVENAVKNDYTSYMPGLNYEIFKSNGKSGNDHFFYKPQYWKINRIQFYQALTYNTYYFKRVMILENGDVKRYLNDKEYWGNILTGNFDWDQLVDNVKFNSLGSLSKDHIEDCCNCSTRYVCNDPRVPLLNTVTKEYYYKNGCKCLEYLK